MHESLTSVFGMGTGGASPLVTGMVKGISLLLVPSKPNNTTHLLRDFFCNFRFLYHLCIASMLWSSPRTISIGQLNTLLHLHLRPIKHIVYVRSYQIDSVGNLILRGASRLDAFSVYPFHT